MLIIAPVAFILVAENLGHIKAVGAMTGENLTPQLGKAFVADGVATAMAAAQVPSGIGKPASTRGRLAASRGIDGPARSVWNMASEDRGAR